MDITVREAGAGELAAAGELVAQAYLGDGLLTFGAADPYLAELRDAARRARHAEVLVATGPGADGRDLLLGSVTFVGSGGEFADIAGPGEAEFRMLAVAAQARGRGAGEALVRECVRRARLLGRRRVVLSSQWRMHAAHRLYARLGFVRAPERDWEPLPDLPLHVFTRELEGSAVRAEG